MRDFYEFFAGGGMARVGLGAGWRCTLANDFDAKKGAVLSGELWRRSSNDRRRGGADDRRFARPSRSRVGVAALPGHLAGRKRRRARRRPQRRLLSLAAPDATINCRGSRAARHRHRKCRRADNVERGADFAAVARLLAEAGYVFGAVVIDAALFVPQSRERVFIVAVRAEASLPPGLAQDDPGAPFHSAALRKAVASLPPSLRACWRWWRLPAPPVRNTTLLDLLDFEAPCDSEAATRRLIELMEPLHFAKVESARATGERAVGAVCFRMRGKKQRAEIRFDGLAHALRTPGGGSSIQRFLLIDGAGGMRSRKPTPRECARLMGLPEDYALPSSTTDAYHLTGDGVVAPVVAWLNANLLSRLADEEMLAEIGRSYNVSRCTMVRIAP